MHGKRSLLLRPSGEAQWVAQSGPINKRRSFGRVWGEAFLAKKIDIPQNKEKTHQSGTKKEVSETSRIRPSVLLIGLILGERDFVLGDSPDLLLVGSSRIQDVTTKKRMPPRSSPIRPTTMRRKANQSFADTTKRSRFSASFK